MIILLFQACCLVVMIALLLVSAAPGATSAPSPSHGGDEVDFPPLLDSDDIAYFFNQGNIDGLHWALSNLFVNSARNPDAASQVQHTSLPQQLVARGGGDKYTTAYKLKMDLEQAEYLAQTLDSRNPELAAFFQNQVANVYRHVLARIPPLDALQRTQGLYPFDDKDYTTGIAAIYNKALYHTNYDELKDAETGNVLPVLNPKLDLLEIQRQWFGENKGDDNDNVHVPPGIVVIDDILSPVALNRIRQVLLESTVWYQVKMPLRFGGYAGAYIDDGLHDRILLQLSLELHRALPRIMKGHALKYLWAYKYDSDYTGINLHADEAAVNVNIWLTPDEANLDPSSGGLVVFTAKPPAGWDFAEYNTNANTERVVKELLEPTGFANVTIPHRQNRAVIFDSALFHHTDEYRFKQGYENRRINLTVLYGDMKRDKSTDDTKSEL